MGLFPALTILHEGYDAVCMGVVADAAVQGLLLASGVEGSIPSWCRVIKSNVVRQLSLSAFDGQSGSSPYDWYSPTTCPQVLYVMFYSRCPEAILLSTLAYISGSISILDLDLFKKCLNESSSIIYDSDMFPAPWNIWKVTHPTLPPSFHDSSFQRANANIYLDVVTGGDIEKSHPFATLQCQ